MMLNLHVVYLCLVQQTGICARDSSGNSTIIFIFLGVFNEIGCAPIADKGARKFRLVVERIQQQVTC